MKTLEITCATTDDEIRKALPFFDMQPHAIIGRDAVREVLGADDRTTLVLQVYDEDGTIALWSPSYCCAYVNNVSAPRADSMQFSDSSSRVPMKVVAKYQLLVARAEAA